MDLGIAGRTALICASSQGLGFACAYALAAEGVEVILNGRDNRRLEKSTQQLLSLAPGARVRHVMADLTIAADRERVVEFCPKPDILITNNAGPPPGSLEDWDRDSWIRAFDANMIPAILLIRAFVPGMRSRGFGRIVNITSAMVKSPHPQMGLSTAARTALTAVCKAISHETAEDNVTINNILPERIDTPRQELMARRVMKDDGVSYEEARRRIAESISAKRFGRPEEFAAACTFLCSVQAGFISGQNLQVDGGTYVGLV